MVSPDSMQISRDFFEDPASYGGFSRTQDGRVLLNCVDPRDMEGFEPGGFPVVLQTGGGAVGEGLDGALALTAISGTFVTIESGMDADLEARPGVLMGAHRRCAFDGVVDQVTDEMSDPSEFTTESTERWARGLDLWDTVAPRLSPVTDAAKRQQEYLRETRPMGGLAPRAAHTVDVRGDNFSGVYVVNLHLGMGMDPNAKPRDAEGATAAQGYHDTLGATILTLREEEGLSDEARGLRMTSMIRRAAATRTVITRGRLSEMALYEVRPSSNDAGVEVVGLEF